MRIHVPSALPHCAEKCIWLTTSIIQWHDSMFRTAYREKAGEESQCMSMFRRPFDKRLIVVVALCIDARDGWGDLQCLNDSMMGS